MRDREEEPHSTNVRQRYSPTIPSQARQIGPPSTADLFDSYDPRRTLLTRVPAGLPISETDMMCPPSLASGSSAVSIVSHQQVLGTPHFYPENYQLQPVTADYRYTNALAAKVEVALEPNGGDRLEMFGTSKTG